MWKTTSWSQILEAQLDNTDAMKKLCEDYWSAIYTFLRYRGFNQEDAEDYTQAFLVRFLDKDWIQRADQNKGKFRTFILTLLQRFVNDQKFTKQNQFEANIITAKKSSVQTIHPSDEGSPEHHFNKIWAESLLEMVLDLFRKEVIQENNIREYEVLWLMFFSGSPSLLLGDIKNPDVFFDTLKKSQSTKFSPEIQQLISSYTIETPLSLDQQNLVIHAINSIFIHSAVYDEHFSLKHVQEYSLYPCDINNFDIFIKVVVEDLRHHLPENLIAKYKKYRNPNSQTPKIQETLLQQLNLILSTKNLSLDEKPEHYAKYPKHHNIKMIRNRIALESTFPSTIENCFVRMNKVFLQCAYANSIIPNIFHCLEPSYSQIAKALGMYKSKIDFIRGKALNRYKRLLTDQVTRYCENNLVEEEIYELLQMLMMK